MGIFVVGAALLASTAFAYAAGREEQSRALAEKCIDECADFPRPVPSRRWLKLGGVVSGVRNPDSGVGAPVETTP